jgi:hypothetical protein
MAAKVGAPVVPNAPANEAQAGQPANNCRDLRKADVSFIEGAKHRPGSFEVNVLVLSHGQSAVFDIGKQRSFQCGLTPELSRPAKRVRLE